MLGFKVWNISFQSACLRCSPKKSRNFGILNVMRYVSLNHYKNFLWHSHYYEVCVTESLQELLVARFCVFQCVTLVTWHWPKANYHQSTLTSNLLRALSSTRIWNMELKKVLCCGSIYWDFGHGTGLKLTYFVLGYNGDGISKNLIPLGV